MPRKIQNFIFLLIFFFSGIQVHAKFEITNKPHSNNVRNILRNRDLHTEAHFPYTNSNCNFRN